jgi:hypothetical protein
MTLLISVASADRDTPLNVLDGLVDYLDRVDTVAAFVVRCAAELVVCGVQVIKRVNHVTLNGTLLGANGLNQRNACVRRTANAPTDGNR